MEINGTLEAIFDTKEFKSGFKKREFVVNTGGDYPQSIKMEVVKDNILITVLINVQMIIVIEEDNI